MQGSLTNTLPCVKQAVVSEEVAVLVLRGGRVLTPGGWLRADLTVADGRVADLGESAATGSTELDVHGCDVLPGFVDLHVHGAGGAWARGPGTDELRTMASALAAGGVTSYLATSIAAPTDELHDLVTAATKVAEPDGGARCAGVHLEGPWLSPARAGAQPKEQLRPVDLAEIESLAAAGPVRLVTIAPELEHALDAVRLLVERGVVVSLGHSDASYDEVVRAVAAGARHVTHCFNAMSGVSHRDPGLAGAALDLDGLTSVEVIADGVHVHPAAVRLLHRARGADTVCLVSDGVDGCATEAELVRDGTVLRRPDGTLAGSALRLADAVRNAVGWGVPLEEAARMASTTPARVLGRPDLGVIEPGALADLVVLGPDLAVRHTVVGGDVVHSAAT